MSRSRPHGWEIVGVDEATKRTIKLYAAAYGLTLPQALAELVEQAASVGLAYGGPPLPPRKPTRTVAAANGLASDAADGSAEPPINGTV